MKFKATSIQLLASILTFINELITEINTRFHVILELANRNVVDYSWFITTFWTLYLKTNGKLVQILIRMNEQWFHERKIIAAREAEITSNYTEIQIPCISNQSIAIMYNKH
ncbi:hypothetical protein BpHYR1_000231 [Brachionus plicatilis]|uniref:Uncharacterized protein n=1 Tax=Brachionus plicatilis TaxID=10195 RepID=A0A3M7PEC9_BRAPC|nr:hypothetical protein BpHYR1_000231 [Brachionus plicatilis]